MPRVSVLLTCYNHFKYLPAALAGVRAQTFQDFEIIALDDGSSDETRPWLLEQEGGKLRCIFNEKNLGTYGTLNVGLREATGEFIAVLNDDDLWLPTKLERQVALLDAHPQVGIVHTDGGFIDGDGNPLPGTPLGFDFPRFETGDLMLRMVYFNQVIASAVMARRACFDQCGPFDDAYFGSGDWDMWFRIAEHWQVGFVGEPLTQYRWHDSNASKKLERIWRDDERLREKIAAKLPVLEGRFSAPEVKAAMAHNLACLGTVRKLNGKPGPARQAYAASLRLSPTRVGSALRWALTFLPTGAFRRTIRW